MRRIFIVCLLALMCNVVSAHDFIVDGICYNITSEEEKTVEVTYNEDEKYAIKRKFYKDVVFVPEKVTFDSKEYTVSAIGERAFTDHEELLSVVMPNTLLVIKDCAFVRCPQLKSITIPASVTEIEPGAFQILGSLTNLAVDEGNKVYDSRKGCNAIIRSKTATLLFGCKSTIIPDGVEVIARNAFWPVPENGVEPFALEIPGSVKVIRSSAFAGREWLNALVLHEGIEVIEGWAFDGTSIESLVIPKSVKRIDPSAFRNNTKLTSIKVKRGNKVYDSRKRCNAIIESKSGKLILGCSESSIPEGVKIIGYDAFARCGIEEVKFPSSLETIESYAFMDCHRLKKVVVPGSVKEIGSLAFCYSGIEEIVVEDGVEKIGENAFLGCKRLKKATLPVTFGRIGSYYSYNGLFHGCRELEWVSLGNENETYYCNGSVLLEKETRTVVDGWGIDQCYVGNGFVRLKAKKIGRRAFEGHELLAEVTLPETLEEIEERAFYGCKALRLIVCKAQVPPLLADDAFAANKRMHDYTLPLHERAVLLVPKGTLDAYRNAPGWKEFKHIKETNSSF